MFAQQEYEIMKFGTDTDKYENWFSKYQQELVNCFHFQVVWWLHNIVQPKWATYVRSDPLPYALQLLGKW